MKSSNHNSNLDIKFKKAIKKVSMFCTKSSVTGRWTYNSKIYFKNGQTSIVKEVFANNMTELVRNTKTEIKTLIK